MSGTPTVAAALRAARAAGIERLDARLLLAFALERTPSWLMAHDDAPLGPGAQARYDGLLRRRADGEPLAYLVGHKEFHGLELTVTPDVLVPRPDTETLVDWALECLDDTAPARVLDLGTGSGAIALALAHRRPRARVTAVDASAQALAVAAGNGERLGLGVEWLEGDWFAPLGGRRFELICANPPYVADGDPHLAALALKQSAGDTIEAIFLLRANDTFTATLGSYIMDSDTKIRLDGTAGQGTEVNFSDSFGGGDGTLFRVDGSWRFRPSRNRTTRAGVPTAMPLSGTSRVTTDPAPITAPAPMRTPDSTIAAWPSHAPSPIVIGPFVVSG